MVCYNTKSRKAFQTHPHIRETRQEERTCHSIFGHHVSVLYASLSTRFLFSRCDAILRTYQIQCLHSRLLVTTSVIICYCSFAMTFVYVCFLTRHAIIAEGVQDFGISESTTDLHLARHDLMIKPRAVPFVKDVSMGFGI